jgi:hypothetical protein
MRRVWISKAQFSALFALHLREVEPEQPSSRIVRLRSTYDAPGRTRHKKGKR